MGDQSQRRNVEQVAQADANPDNGEQAKAKDPTPTELLAGLAFQAKRQFGLITKQALLDAGMDAGAIHRAIASRKLERLFCGVYAFAGSTETRERRFAAAQLWYGPDAALSHYSAARVWELQDVPDMYAVDVIRVGRFKRPKRFGIKAHETEDLPAEDVVEHKGLRVTTPLRTVVDLARVMKPQKLEIVILDAIARGLFTKEQLIARCQQERRVRTRSAAKLIQAVNRAGFEIHTESPLEREALQFLIDEGLKPEHGQVELWRAQPRKFIGRYDQAWESLRLLIEVDSRRYHRALAQKERDDEKDREAAELAYAVVRIRKEHLKGEQRPNLLAHLREKVSSAPARIAWAHACPASRLVPARPKRKQGRRAQRGNRQLPLLNEATFKGRQDSRSPSLH